MSDDTFPDERPLPAAFWITATRNDKVLTRAELAPFAADLLAAYAADNRKPRPFVELTVVSRGGVPAIRIYGTTERREAARVALGQAFYAADLKWLATRTDFDWLVSKGMAGSGKRPASKRALL